MRNVHIDYRGQDHGFQAASLLAKDAAKENQMKDPTIIAWYRSSRLGAMPPFYDGANPETWWEKYGEGNGGRLEVSVGEDYQFIMMDARGYETVGDMPLRNLTDREGNPYLCYTPLQGMDSSIPKQEACTLLDGRSVLKPGRFAWRPRDDPAGMCEVSGMYFTGGSGR